MARVVEIIGKPLCEALGLDPDHVMELHITLKVGDPAVLVQAKVLVDELDRVVTAIKEFEIREVQ